MKRFFVLLLLFFIGINEICFAEGDLWDNFGDQNVYGQKPVTDQEFEKALESKQKKKKNKNIPKGENIQQSNETEIINKKSEELPTLLIPLTLQVHANQTIPIGYYQVVGEKKEDKINLKLYQSHDLIANIPATETNDDFGEKTITFVRLSQYSTKQVRIIFGNIDFNAYAIINIAQQEE